MTKLNDIDLSEWKRHGDLWTDSLWLIDNRDKSGAHNNAYHGNFVPQIPNQLMRRFTATGDAVLDPFLGLGTTLIESKKLGRHGIGIELIPEVARAARLNIGRERPATGKTFAEVIVADSATASARTKVARALKKIGKKKVHLVLLHPPYHDIIKFSDSQRDLSNSPTVKEFAAKFGDVVENFSGLLAMDRYLAVVIGDKYANSEWVPLGFHLMRETLKRDRALILKSIVVKNMVHNRAKLNQENLWRYRALKSGFYIFKHEYILVFQKKGRRPSRPLSMESEV